MNPAITPAQMTTAADMISNGAVVYSMSTHFRSGALSVRGPIDGTAAGRIEVIAIIDHDGRQIYSRPR